MPKVSKKPTQTKPAVSEAFNPVQLPGSISITEPIPVTGDVTHGITHWEYFTYQHVFTLSGGTTPTDVQLKLTDFQIVTITTIINNLGIAGWELVETSGWKLINKELISLFYFKRPVIT